MLDPTGLREDLFVLELVASHGIVTHVSWTRICPCGQTTGDSNDGTFTVSVSPGSETDTATLHGWLPAMDTLTRCSPGSTGMGVFHAA